MIQRRQFLTAVAGLTTAAAFATPSRADAVGRNLNWYCDVIKTIPHTKSQRRPVVTGVAVQQNSDLVAIVGDDHYVCVYSLAENKFTQHAKNHDDWVRAAQFSPDGTRLATVGNDRKLIITEIEDIKTPVIEKRQPEAIIDLAWSADGSKIATVGFERKLRIYDTETGTRITEQNCASADNRCVAFSKDDTMIAAGGRSGAVKVWSADSMELIATLKNHRQRVRSISFTADNKILSASEDQIVSLTDPKNIQDTQKTIRLGAKLFATENIENGFFATGGSDNQVVIWNTESMTALGSLMGHTGTVSCLAAKPNTLVSGSYDASVRVWKMEMDSSVMTAPVIKDRHTQLPPGWSPTVIK